MTEKELEILRERIAKYFKHDFQLVPSFKSWLVRIAILNGADGVDVDIEGCKTDAGLHPALDVLDLVVRGILK